MASGACLVSPPLRELAVGGQASITLARTEDGTLVVLKRCLTKDPSDEKCLRDEARIGKRLRHKSIVCTVDLVEDDWALGIVILEAALGRPLYTGTTAQVLQQSMRPVPLPVDALAALPAPLRQCIEPLLVVDAARREADARKAAFRFEASASTDFKVTEADLAAYVGAATAGSPPPGGDDDGEDAPTWIEFLDARTAVTSSRPRGSTGASQPRPASRSSSSSSRMGMGIAAGAAVAAVLGLGAFVALRPAREGSAPVVHSPAAEPAGDARAAPPPSSAPSPSTSPSPSTPAPASTAAVPLLPAGSVWRLRFGADPKNKNVTSYFRASFDVADPASLPPAIVLRVQRDDGVAVYLNGIEVARDGLKPDAGAFDLALHRIDEGGDEQRWLEFPIAAALVKPGRNVVAAEVHQVMRNSSDLGFEAEIVAR